MALLCLLFFGVALATPDTDSALPVSTIQDTVNKFRTNLGTVTVSDRTIQDPIGLFRVDLSGGKFGDLSSMSLRGYDHEIRKITDDKGVKLLYETTVGLDKLLTTFGYTYSYLYFFRGTGNLKISGNEQLAVRVKGFVNKANKGYCYSFIQEAEIRDFGEFEAIDADNLLLKWYSKFLINFLMPLFKPAINDYLQLQIDYKIPQTDLSRLICESLPDGLLTLE